MARPPGSPNKTTHKFDAMQVAGIKLGVDIAAWLPEQLNAGRTYRSLGRQLGVSQAIIPIWMQYLGYTRIVTWVISKENHGDY